MFDLNYSWKSCIVTDDLMFDSLYEKEKKNFVSHFYLDRLKLSCFVTDDSVFNVRLLECGASCAGKF